MAGEIVSPALSFDEAPASANCRIVDASGFEWQITVRASDWRDLLRQAGELRAALVKAGCKPAGGRSSGANANGASANAPTCPTHGSPMKQSQHGGGWFCPVKVADDGGDGKAVYCRQKVK